MAKLITEGMRIFSMANRNFASGGKIYSMHVMPVMLDATANIGAAGVVSSIAGPLIESIEHLSTGLYKIHLSDSFNRLFSAVGSVASPAVGLSGIATVELQNDASASVSDLNDPSLTVKCLDASGALADPADGSALKVMIYLSNSSVVIQGE